MHIGEVLHMLATARAMTDQELARGAGLNGSCMSQFKRGFRTPSLDSLNALAKVLQVPVGLILDLAQEPEAMMALGEERKQDLARRLFNILFDPEGKLGRKRAKRNKQIQKKRQETLRLTREGEPVASEST